MTSFIVETFPNVEQLGLVDPGDVDIIDVAMSLASKLPSLQVIEWWGRGSLSQKERTVRLIRTPPTIGLWITGHPTRTETVHEVFGQIASIFFQL